ncbi:MAG: phosphoglycerate kinase [Patescibacteria group bacterium]|nr:phosphoglycerate kinase [Patescibacteria group bacterium]
MINLKNKYLLRLNGNKIRNKRVLIRVDYNINLKNKNFEDIYRIKQSLSTINFLIKNKAKQIILITHLGRPKNKNDKNLSTKKILPFLKKYLPQIKYYFWQPSFKLPFNHIILLENIRFFKEEEKNDYDFALSLSKLGDIFVNEAFSVSHRQHSSVYQLKKFLLTYYGLNFEKEIENLNYVLKKDKGVGLVIGGIKSETKIPLIRNFLKKADVIILGGGIVNTFLQAKNFEVGQSIIDRDYLREFKKIKSNKIIIPFDFQTNKGYRYLGEINPDEIIYDIGPESIKEFINNLKMVDLIVWNGPLGWIENKKYFQGSKLFVQLLSKLKKYKIAGGGETLTIINSLKLNKNFNFLSTGGGAMLYYLAYQKLPVFEEY